MSDTDKGHLENREQLWADGRLPREDHGRRGSQEAVQVKVVRWPSLVREARQHLKSKRRDEADDQGPEGWSEEPGGVPGGDLKLQPLRLGQGGLEKMAKGHGLMWARLVGQSINRTVVEGCWEVLPSPSLLMRFRGSPGMPGLRGPCCSVAKVGHGEKPRDVIKGP